MVCFRNSCRILEQDSEPLSRNRLSIAIWLSLLIWWSIYCYRTSHDDLTWRNRRDHWMIRNGETRWSWAEGIYYRKSCDHHHTQDMPRVYQRYDRNIPRLWSEHIHDMTRTYPRYDLGILRIGSGWIYKDAHFMYLGFGSSRLLQSQNWLTTSVNKYWLHSSSLLIST